MRPLPGAVPCVVLVVLGAGPAAADVVVTQSFAGLTSRAAFDSDGNGVLAAGEDASGPPLSGNAAGFSEVSQISVGPALGFAQATTSVSAGPTSLAASASGDCETRAPGSADVTDPLRIGESRADFRVEFTLTEPARFSLSGSVSVNAPIGQEGGGGNRAGVLTSLGSLDIEADDAFLDPQSDSGSASGEIPPGSYAVSAFCTSQAPRSGDAAPSGRGRFQLTLQVEELEAGEVFRWVGPTAGVFGEDGNWDPEGPATSGVPGFVPGVRSDTALFDRGRVELDLAALAPASRPARGPLAACAGPVNRSVGRLVLDRVRELAPFGGALALDSLSLDAPSLTIGDGGVLALRDATLCARHARIGAEGRRSLAFVSGPGGVLQTLGRLSVGGLGEGLLQIESGGIASSKEVLVGDGEAQGLAVVTDATWQTGSLAVGFRSPGELAVEGAGLLESQIAFVDRDLDPASSDVARATVRGAGSTWRVTDLAIGGRGTVEVDEGGLLENQGTVVLVGDAADPGEATLLVNEGGELETPLLGVGSTGRGRLVVAEAFDRNPRVDVDAELVVGGTPASRGRVAIVGDPSTDDFALASDLLRVGGAAGARGEIVVDFGGKLLTRSDAFVGTDGGIGRVLVLGAALGSPQALTRWQVAGSLTLGAPGDAETGVLVIRDAAVEVGSPGMPGDVLVQSGGAILGTGSLENLLRVHGGSITNHGLIAGPLTLDGSYDPASTGTLQTSLAGLPPSPQQLAARSPAGAIAALGAPRKKKPQRLAQGPVVFSGDVDLAGRLVLQFRNGFAPAQGDAFPIVVAGGAVAGAFGEIVVRGLAPGAGFEQTVEDGRVTLTSLTDAVALPSVRLAAKRKLKEPKRARARTPKRGGAVTFERNGDTSQPLLVHYRVGGTAENGIDYETLSGLLEIPAGKRSAKLAIRPFREGIPEPDETIEIEVLPGDDYTPGLASTAELRLRSAE